ncbi:MAG: hypothetical protein V5A23_03010 [Halobacteriales archaeon]
MPGDVDGRETVPPRNSIIRYRSVCHRRRCTAAVITSSGPFVRTTATAITALPPTTTAAVTASNVDDGDTR